MVIENETGRCAQWPRSVFKSKDAISYSVLHAEFLPHLLTMDSAHFQQTAASHMARHPRPTIQLTLWSECKSFL